MRRGSAHSSLLQNMVSGTHLIMRGSLLMCALCCVCSVVGAYSTEHRTYTSTENEIPLTSPFLPRLPTTAATSAATTSSSSASSSSEASTSSTESYPKYEKIDFRFLTNQTSTTKVEIIHPSVRKIDEPHFFENKTNNFRKSGFTTGNELWDGLINDCLKKPTFSCIQKNVYHYLDDTLSLGNINVTDHFVFVKNKVDYTKYTKEANDQTEKENEIPEENARSADSPIEEVTNALYGKGMKFMMTHDIELKMPEMMFEGATFRISPRSFEGNGALVKLELIPKTEIENKETGRILFKKIKKFFQNKLLLAFLAIVLVIKLIKIKIMWILPLLVGVGTAKKLVLKFLLFLFPALSHIFKLCSWYHHSYHHTKYHHHQHHINHLHTVIPPWFHEHEHHHGPELIFTKPPAGHPSEYIHGAPSGVHQHFQPEWEFSGPGLGSEYIGDISDRNAQVNSFKPKLDDLKEIHSWGLGSTVSPTASHSFNTNPLLQDPSRIMNVKSQPSPVYVPKRGQAASQIAAQYGNPSQEQLIREAQRQEALRIQAEQALVAQQQKILQQQPFVQDVQQNLVPKISAIMDPFYDPILTKMDKIFLQLGFNEEPCKERLVCSMYKNPNRFSPHSNFISAELSRDTSELQKPIATNPSVIRFYRYVQAARDGQDQRDCLRLYPQCAINTE